MPADSDRFDGLTIGYTYDNGWSFTNTFEGRIHRSTVPRGDLEEEVEIVEVRPDLYFLSWIDDEMGLLAQIIDLENGLVLAAIPQASGTATTTLTGSLDS